MCVRVCLYFFLYVSPLCHACRVLIYCHKMNPFPLKFTQAENGKAEQMCYYDKCATSNWLVFILCRKLMHYEMCIRLVAVSLYQCRYLCMWTEIDSAVWMAGGRDGALCLCFNHQPMDSYEKQYEQQHGKKCSIKLSRCVNLGEWWRPLIVSSGAKFGRSLRLNYNVYKSSH